MSAVSRKVMPRSSAASMTARVPARSRRRPKLLQPRPTAETVRPDAPRGFCRMTPGCPFRQDHQSMADPAPEEDELDARFSLANERTFLAWIRTSLALLAGGLPAAKALNFNHDVYRWIVAAPPIALGATLAIEAVVRWRVYESAMREGRRLPAGRGVKLFGVAVAVYAVFALTATILDG